MSLRKSRLASVHPEIESTASALNMTSGHHKIQLFGMTKRLYLVAPICHIQIALATTLLLDGH